MRNIRNLTSICKALSGPGFLLVAALAVSGCSNTPAVGFSSANLSTQPAASTTPTVYSTVPSTSTGSSGSLMVTPTLVTVMTGGTAQFSVTGGVAPFTFTESSSTGGTITGAGLFTAPGSPGSASVVVTDANGSTATAQITVIDSTSISSLTISPVSVTVGDSGAVTFSASGGTGTYAFSIIGNYGNGATIDAQAGTFSAPSTDGSLQVQVTDSSGALGSLLHQ